MPSSSDESFSRLLAREARVVAEQRAREDERIARQADECGRASAAETRRRADLATRAAQLWRALTTQAWPASELHDLWLWWGDTSLLNAEVDHRRRLRRVIKSTKVHHTPVAVIPFYNSPPPSSPGEHDDRDGKRATFLVTPLLPPCFVILPDRLRWNRESGLYHDETVERSDLATSPG